MKRIIGMGLVFLSSTLLLPGTASADQHGTITNLDVTDAQLNEDGTVTVTGTITCNPGARWRVGAQVFQDGNDSRRSADQGTCTGSPQNFRITVAPGPGDDFDCGEAEAVVRAQTGTNPPRDIRDDETDSETVVLCDGENGGTPSA